VGLSPGRAYDKTQAVRNRLSTIAAALLLVQSPAAVAAGAEPAWTITLNHSNFIVGPALQQLRTRHAWTVGFNEQGRGFQVALRKTSVSIPAPRCRMDYLILEIPSYYPETPKQASPEERRAVYDALIKIQEAGGGSMTARVEAPLGLARDGASGAELVACNLYFALPLSVQVSGP
jgi:hypothetical protein